MDVQTYRVIKLIGWIGAAALYTKIYSNYLLANNFGNQRKGMCITAGAIDNFPLTPAENKLILLSL